jgi:hypothetical protein
LYADPAKYRNPGLILVAHSLHTLALFNNAVLNQASRNVGVTHARENHCNDSDTGAPG